MKFLPKNWILIPLGDCCQIISGSTPKRNKPEYWGGDIPWVTPKDLGKLKTPVLKDAPEKITEAGYKSCSTTLLPQGSILFSSRAPIGYVAIAGRPMCTNQGFKSLVPNEYVHSPYLYWCMRKYASDIEALGSGTTFKEVSKGIVERFIIPLPPLEEQRRIAAILDKADGVRRKRKEAIRLTEELLRSTFLEMFGDPVTNPKGWEIVKLGSLVVGQLNNGIFKKNHEYGGDTPVVWVKELFSGYTIDCSESRTLTPTDEEVKKFGLTKGDILFCRSSLNREGIGFNNVFDGMDFSALFECHIIRVSLNQRKVNSIFLNYLLRFPGLRKQIIAKANTVTMSTIGQSEIKKIEFYLPPKELQDKFEIFLRKIATNRTKLENKESENLFNSLLQRAFRGEL